MNKLSILLFVLSILAVRIDISAQTLSEAQKMYEHGEYEKAKPVFENYIKKTPSNGNYNLWYGVCCLKTGDAATAVKYLETAVKKRVPSGRLYLGQAYDKVYRYEDAIATWEEYIKDLIKHKRSTDEAEDALERSKVRLRMLKGVEQVCIIDSFVTDKTYFLQTYKLNPESGKLHTYSEYFKDEKNTHGNIVYEPELGNKIYYSELQSDSTFAILYCNKLIDQWTKGNLLPLNFNDSANADYPYVMSDGITIYYASDGDGSIGGYDIMVTRYNTNTDTYLTPENVGMPFNSPYNDYMYVIDEFNNLGWFASDRYQPEGKVCIYVFIPNTSKQVYDYESMDPEQLRRLAALYSIKDTWNNTDEIESAKSRLQQAMEARPNVTDVKYNFEFIIDDKLIYHSQEDFRSPQAKQLYNQYQELGKNRKLLADKLENMRTKYAESGPDDKTLLSPAIIDLEKRLKQMSAELAQTAILIRQAEKNEIK